MERKKIIIFGATGNVGSYVFQFASHFFDGDEYEIIATGRRDTDFFARRGFDYYSVDISVDSDFKRLPESNVYAVIYLAADIPAYMDGYFPSKYVTSNIVGSYNILEYCRRVHADRVLFSTTAYDVWEFVRKNPTTPVRPYADYDFSYTGDHAMYVISKNTTTEFLKHYYEEYGLRYFVFRFPTIYSYSPDHHYYPGGVKKIRPVYLMIENAMKGLPIELWGDPAYSKDMVYVDDCAQMLCKAVEAKYERGFYNVGTGIPITMKEQVETIIDVFSPKDRRSEIIYRPEKPVGGGILMDIQNAVDELGYRPAFNCRGLFEAYKEEMQVNRFYELRCGGDGR